MSKKNWLKTIGIYHFVSAFIGFLAVLAIMQKNQSLEFILLGIICFSMSVCSIVSGINCLKQNNLGLILSAIVQSLQIFGFSLYGIGFHFMFGMYLTVSLKTVDIYNLSFSFGVFNANFHISYSEPFYLHINLVPIFFLVKIFSCYKINKIELPYLR